MPEPLSSFSYPPLLLNGEGAWDKWISGFVWVCHVFLCTLKVNTIFDSYLLFQRLKSAEGLSRPQLAFFPCTDSLPDQSVSPVSSLGPSSGLTDCLS